MRSLEIRLTLPRALNRFRPRIPALGFGIASVYEGPPAAVHEEERRLARDMPPQRRADFLTGRCALHRALRTAGLAVRPVLVDGPRPALPAGIAASLSHSAGTAVALAGPAYRFPLLGVDLELAELPVEAAHLVLHASEFDGPAGEPIDRPGPAGRQALTAVYSAKEAAFKALSPVLGTELPGLRALRVRPRPAGFTAYAAARPGLQVQVTVRRLPQGVLSWALSSPVEAPC